MQPKPLLYVVSRRPVNKDDLLASLRTRAPRITLRVMLLALEQGDPATIGLLVANQQFRNLGRRQLEALVATFHFPDTEEILGTLQGARARLEAEAVVQELDQASPLSA